MRRRRWLLSALRGLGLLLLIIALARPQKGKAESAYYGEGIDIMLAVDISGSMLSEDFTLGGQRASRLDVVKSVVGAISSPAAPVTASAWYSSAHGRTPSAR